MHGRELPPLDVLLGDLADGVLVELDARVVYANVAYAKFLGYRGPDLMTGRPVSDFVADEDGSRVLQFGWLRLRGERVPSRYIFSGRCSDGTTVRLAAAVSMSTRGGRSYIVTIVRPLAGDVASDTAAAPCGTSHESLSPREREVMQLVLAGKRIKEVAFHLGISQKTASTHHRRVLEKIGLSDTRALFEYAVRHRIVQWQ